MFLYGAYFEFCLSGSSVSLEITWRPFTFHTFLVCTSHPSNNLFILSEVHLTLRYSFLSAAFSSTTRQETILRIV
jgi:hypothetical protein